MFAGTMTFGGVVSWTVTENEPCAELPESSVAVHVTDVVPTGNVLPDGGEHDTVTLVSTRSLPEAENATTAPDGPVAFVVTLAGTVMLGAVVSCTVTENDAEPVFERVSVAEHVTFVVPRGNVLPDAGEQLAGSAPSTVSDAEAEKLTAAPPGPVASAVIPPGTVTTGGVVSWTVTLNDWDEVSFVIGSVAEHVTVVVVIGNVVPDGGAHETGTGIRPSSIAVGSGHEKAAPPGPVASSV
jgi:hypothetical protein